MLLALFLVALILAALYLEDRPAPWIGPFQLEACLDQADTPLWLSADSPPIWAPACSWPLPQDEELFPDLFRPAPPTGAPLLRARARQAFLAQARDLGLAPAFVPEADEPIILTPAALQWANGIESDDKACSRPLVPTSTLLAARANYLARIGASQNSWETR